MLSQSSSNSMVIGRVSHSGPFISRRNTSRSVPFEPQRIRATDPGCSTSPTTSPRRPSVTKPTIPVLPVASVASSKPFEVPEYLLQSSLSGLFAQDPPTLDAHMASVPAVWSDDEDSDGEAVSVVRRSTLSKQDQSLRLPIAWDKRVSHSSLSIGHDGRELAFAGPNSTGDANAGAARTVYPIPPACGIWYYEVEILERGSKAHISIGFAGPQVRTNRLPGWEKDSWGYHADDGLAFAADKHGANFGPSYGSEDVIGCGIDFSQHRAFYTKNGSFIGWAFKDIGTGPIYPSVGMRHDKESTRANFGQDPFRFDILGFVKSRREEVWKDIIRFGSDRGRGSSEEIKRLVRSYLAHHGYVKTIRSLDNTQKQSLPKSLDSDVDMSGDASDIPEIEQRSRWLDAIRAGDVEPALSQIPPSVLSANGGLLSLKLRCRGFIELILREDAVDDTALLEYGRKISADYSSDNRPFVRDLLQRTFGAAAYENRATAVRDAIGDVEAGRLALAAEVNRALLRSQSREPQPALERAFRQASAYTVQLGVLGVGQAAFADIRRELLD